MKIKQQQWTIERLIKDKDKININPAWQRGPAWQLPRQILLIDSILRGMDIPKIYLRALTPGGLHTHDAVDGQQRLRSIYDFKAEIFILDHPEKLLPIEGIEVAGLSYKTINDNLRQRFNDFEISVAEIESSSRDEIINLFFRLQMGVSLNPAELRNATNKPLRHVIDALATSHEFFLNSKVANSRYKRQDYAAHAFAVAAYGTSKDIKAPNLLSLYEEYDQNRSVEVLKLLEEVGDALNIMTDVNNHLGGLITQKWIFVDLCFLIMENLKAGIIIDPAKLAKRYRYFDIKRREYNRHPDDLLRTGQGILSDLTLNPHLYDYIGAFRVQSGDARSLSTRASALNAFCPSKEIQV